MTRESRREHNPVEARSPEAARYAARLAPPEERQAIEQDFIPGANGNRGLALDTGELKLPAGIAEEERKSHRLMGVHPVVALIFAVVIAFIVFITYLISIEPPR